MPSHPDGSDRGPFWAVFDQSQIPMALISRERRYVAVNDAALELYERPREQVIGELASSGMPDDPAVREARWQQLMRTGELYGERVVRHFSGPPMRVSFAAHAIELDREWLALFVMLSAHVEPAGQQLIGPVTSPGSSQAQSAALSSSKPLTPREREVIERVALGRSTPQIAADLHLSPATVRTHVRNAMVKTGAHTRAQLVALVLGEELALD